jgi:hypothetical protein
MCFRARPVPGTKVHQILGGFVSWKSRLVVSGMLNKHIAAQIGASEATVKIHRGHVMEKMQAGSLIELVRMADKLKLSPNK